MNAYAITGHCYVLLLPAPAVERFAGNRMQGGAGTALQ